MQTHSIPETGFLRLEQIIGNRKANIVPIIPVGRTTWLNGVKKGIYPQPRRLSERTVAWRVEDILQLIADLESA